MAAWRVIIGDRFGNTITNVSPIAIAKQYLATLNRPAQFTFRVPAHDPRVAGLAGDGFPLVGEGRTIRAYRQEAQQDGSVAWVPRFAGHIWQVTDDGGDSDQWTTCVCFDPLQMLGRRYARAMAMSPSVDLGIFITQAPGGTGEWTAGPFLTFATQTITDLTNNTGVVTPQPGTDIARGLLNCTNNTDGFSGMIDAYPSSYWQGSAVLPVGLSTGARDGVPGLYPVGYGVGADAIARPPLSPTVAPSWDHSNVAQAIIDLTAMYNGFDFQVVPLGLGTQYAGYTGGGVVTEYPTIDGAPRHMLGRMAIFQALASLKFYAPQRGSTKTGAMFAWGAAPHTAKAISRTIDLDQLVNNCYATGASAYAQALNLASVNRYGAAMSDVSATDVTDASQLAALASEAVLLGGGAVPTYTVTPMPGRAPLPFDSFDLGDIVAVAAGANLRGGFSGQHRVYSYTLDMPDDTDKEVLSAVVTSPVV